jgi:NADPH:quinone reductase-like Zn-dependent oxidoreductase
LRAALYDRFGPPDVLRIGEVADPSPRRGEVLVRVRAAALNPKDVLVRAGKLRLASGRRFPKRVGWDWSGEACAIGPGVRDVRVGDELYGMIQAMRAGACAELAAVKASECASKPPSLSFEEAASLPLAAQTALQALRDVARAAPGMRLLINGSSGGVGTFTIQIAKILGLHVTTTSSGENVAACRELGADEALDYTAVDALGTGERYDVIFDVFGNRRYRQARRALRPGGTYVSTVLRAHVFAAIARSLMSSTRARLVVVRSRRRDLETLAAWVEAGRLRPRLDSVHALEAIAAAEERMASKHARGKVVVRIA